MMTIAQEQRVTEFKKMRQILGLSQIQLAEKLNITGLSSSQMSNLISCWETRKKPIPDDCFINLQRLFNDNILASASKKPEQVMPHSIFTRDDLIFRTFPTYELAEQHASVIVKETGRTVEIGSLVVTHIVQPQVAVKIIPISQSRADVKEHKNEDNDEDLILNNDEINDDSNHFESHAS